MKTLDEIFDDVATYMCSNVEFDPYCTHTGVYFLYENFGYVIEGEGTVSGTWHRDGDGYDTPVDYYLTGARGEVFGLSIHHYDEDGEEDVTFSDEVVGRYMRRLDKALNNFVKDGGI